MKRVDPITDIRTCKLFPLEQKSISDWTSSAIRSDLSTYAPHTYRSLPIMNLDPKGLVDTVDRNISIEGEPLVTANRSSNKPPHT